MQRERVGFEAAPIVFHPRHRLIYVASLRPGEGDGNRMRVFHVAKDGRLKRGPEVAFQHGSAYLSLDRSSQFLLGASYFEGHVDVYRLNERGIPSEPPLTVHEGRDKAHSILTSRDNRFAYVPYVKNQNGMFQYGFDEQTGKLTPLDPAQAKVADGAGPRHVAFHPTKPLVFFSNEQQLGVSAYRIQSSGQLQLLGVAIPGALQPRAGVAASDIVVTRDGRFVYVGVRDFDKGQVDAIHGYRVEASGKVVHIGRTAADAIPWGLRLSPAGGHLLVTAAHGETLTAYRIGGNGSLRKRASIKWGKMIRDIAVVVTK
ncbi:MAG: beta-propeller fold lactonase family protein [Pirellulaceae bacterium]|nr:beta-propeller fold lactonase family protein [Pirellulaceae bacterium]MDP7016656.1 beta-propeller fold lactonase family protein [Pirellulaceae bacterium]